MIYCSATVMVIITGVWLLLLTVSVDIKVHSVSFVARLLQLLSVDVWLCHVQTCLSALLQLSALLMCTVIVLFTVPKLLFPVTGWCLGGKLVHAVLLKKTEAD